jgi:hypothetical protein
MATAVMSSFGAVSPRKSWTAKKIASTISREGLSRISVTTSSNRSVPNSRPRESLAADTPAAQKT